MGAAGLAELAKFVQAGGTLITEGSTSAFVADYGLAGGVSVEHPSQLFARGSILRGQFTDLKSPIAYGYDQKDLPVYFNQDPVFAIAEGRSGGGGGSASGSAFGQNVTPNAAPIHISPYDQPAEPAAPPFDEAAYMRQNEGAYTAECNPTFLRASSCSSQKSRMTCFCPAPSPAAKRSPSDPLCSTQTLGKVMS